MNGIDIISCKIIHMCIGTINILFYIFLSILLLLSGFSTSFILDGEHTVFVRDSMLMNIGITVSVFVFGWFVWKKKNEIRKFLMKRNITYEKLRNTIFLFFFLGGIIFLLSTQLSAKWDQVSVMYATKQLHDGGGSLYEAGGYMARFHNQIGFVVLIYIVGHVFGTFNYEVFQIMNLLALILSYKNIVGISETLGLKKGGKLGLLGMLLIFLPFNIYIVFCYGNLLGFSLAVTSIKYEMHFMKNGRYSDMVKSGIMLGLAVMVKSNYLIFAIAMIIWALLETLRSKRKRMLLLIVCMGLFIGGFQSLSKNFVERKIGYELSEGISPYAFIAMGLQDNDVCANGWFNNYISESFSKCDFDSDQQKKMALKSISHSLERFKRDKEYAITFFAEKIASQWNNPTFQCFWILKDVNSDILPADWYLILNSVSFQEKMIQILNAIQFMVLSGAFLELLLSKNDMHFNSFIFRLIFIGGFVFHVFWEAKCQYTLPYFVLLIPLAAAGIKNLYFQMDKGLRIIQTGEIRKWISYT